MTYKILTVAVLSLGLGTAVAMAQTDTAPSTDAAPSAAPADSLPTGWDGAIGDAFFSDTEMGTLRSQDEVRTNWDTLSDEQQAQVRSHCDTMDTAAATAGSDAGADTTAGTGATTGSGTDTMADTSGSGMEADDDMTTGSTTPGAMQTASIEQVCDWVGEM